MKTSIPIAVSSSFVRVLVKRINARDVWLILWRVERDERKVVTASRMDWPEGNVVGVSDLDIPRLLFELSGDLKPS